MHEINGLHIYLYRAWLLEDGNVIRCVCDTSYGDGDVNWECYNPNCDLTRFSTDVISRDHAREYLKQSHVSCGFYGDV